MTEDLTTRRQLIRGVLSRGGTVSAGFALAGIAGAPSASAAPSKTDAQLTADLVAVELLVAAVYVRTLDSGHLSPRGARIAHPVLAQERAHTAALTRELRALGGVAPAPPANIAAIDQALADRHVSRRLANLHSERDCLQLLLDAESVVQRAHYDALSLLHSMRLVLLSAQILANEGQHEALLGALIHPKDLSVAVPYAFVEGA